MSHVYIRVPVICPRCAQESLIPLSVDAIVEHVDHEVPLRLNSPCHSHAWYANSDETVQIREYLREVYNFASHESSKQPSLQV